MRFNDDFVFGSGTAAYQVEGAVSEGGRSPSIWDTMCHEPGRIANGDTGDVACDQYHRWSEDLSIMSSLGLEAYRFSISWSRVLPDSSGVINPEGVAYYRRICEDLHEAGILAYATLYHWDLPQWLQDRGGWGARETAYDFASYAAIMAHELGDVVDVWSTLNEPWCSSYLGHASGVHAPGHTNPLEALRAVHHLNLAHGLATHEIRSTLGNGARVCLTLNLHVVNPATDSEDDRAAAGRVEVVGNEAFLGPVMDGVLPPELIAVTSDITDWSFVLDGDLAICHQVPDILGINYYSSSTVKSRTAGDGHSTGGHGSTDVSPWVGCDNVTFLAPKGPLTAMEWNIDPNALRELLVGLSHRYPGQPLMITENGAAFPDKVTSDGHIHDSQRIEYLRSHIQAVGEAIESGAPVKGYFLWSLLDNFEWSWGYDRRFGIVRLDYATLERTLKDSAIWYGQVISTRQIE